MLDDLPAICVLAVHKCESADNRAYSTFECKSEGVDTGIDCERVEMADILFDDRCGWQRDHEVFEIIAYAVRCLAQRVRDSRQQDGVRCIERGNLCRVMSFQRSDPAFQKVCDFVSRVVIQRSVPSMTSLGIQRSARAPEAMDVIISRITVDQNLSALTISQSVTLTTP